MSLRIRSAEPRDVPTVLRLIRALAEYERMLDQVEAAEEDLLRTLFAPEPRVFCLLAEVDESPAGLAIWFYSYSTFLCRHGVWLEDLFVEPARRGQGVGKALLRALAQRCVDENLGRLEWNVLGWNEPAIGFYRSIGATSKQEFVAYQLAGASLAAFASG